MHAIARATEAGAAAGHPSEILVLDLAGQRYGLDVAVVDRLVRAVAVVALPRAPHVVEGVIDVGGALVPVLDVRRRFGLPARAPHHGDHLVLARAGHRLVALRCERATGIARVDPGQVEDARRAVPGADWVAGVVRLPDGLVLIHDLRTFLSLDEAAALDGALAGSGPSLPPGGAR